MLHNIAAWGNVQHLVELKPPKKYCGPNWGGNNLFYSNAVKRPLKLACFTGPYDRGRSKQNCESVKLNLKKKKQKFGSHVTFYISKDICQAFHLGMILLSLNVFHGRVPGQSMLPLLSNVGKIKNTDAETKTNYLSLKKHLNLFHPPGIMVAQ